jgi:hypothetical protein
MGTPTHIFLMVSDLRERPASSSFTFLNKNKAACDRFGKNGGCRSRRTSWAAKDF